MSIVLCLSTFAVRQLAGGACRMAGTDDVVREAARFLSERFVDHSQRLTRAVSLANDNAWKALEIALAGDSFWERCKSALARGDEKAFAQQVRLFLDAAPLPELAGKTAFRHKCLEELRGARKTPGLIGGAPDPRHLAERTADFARFTDPQRILDAEWRLAEDIAALMKEAGFGNLAWLLAQRPAQGAPILLAGARYFFRRAVEEDRELFQGLSFAKLEALADAQESGFASLSRAIADQAQQIEDLLGSVQIVVVQTHGAVLDLQSQLRGQGAQIQQIGDAVMKLLEQHQLQRRELRPSDSLSIRSDAERQLVKQLVQRYRALPVEQQRQAPAMLNALGKLQVVAGDFGQAQSDFIEVATLVSDAPAQAEALHNAYRAALEQRDWPTALQQLREATRLDPRRHAPFPLAKYQPRRILGAGGFGVAFACRHTELDAEVVVKTLNGEDLSRDVDDVFNEARVLYQLDHPNIIRLLDCGYAFPDEKARPYFVMHFFDGVNLEDQVRSSGPIAFDELVPLARQVAEGLRAAHAKGILHRDVKPANLLVRKDGDDWRVKIIDFGLALKQSSLVSSASTSRQNPTLAGSSVAGTLDYAAPEQMGRLPGVAVGRYSDVYGFGKTCCYALFRTTQPLPKHFRGLPAALTELIEDCLEESPEKRPTSFEPVLKRLAKIADDLVPTVVPTAQLVEIVEPQLAAPMVTVAATWYYLQDGKQFGPVTDHEIVGLARGGVLGRGDLVWKQGMPQWSPAGALRELADQMPVIAEIAPVPPVRRTTSRVRLFSPSEHLLKKGMSKYMAFFGKKALLKVYWNGGFVGEAAACDGFDLDVEAKPGRHVLEVAHWDDGEKDRKRFDLTLDKLGRYEVRFNHVWNPTLFGGGTMASSTIDIVKQPT
jgi:tetratricopeptide (TPR) repeat protein